MNKAGIPPHHGSSTSFEVPVMRVTPAIQTERKAYEQKTEIKDHAASVLLALRLREVQPSVCERGLHCWLV